MRIFSALLLAVSTAFVLAACGGGGGGESSVPGLATPANLQVLTAVDQ